MVIQIPADLDEQMYRKVESGQYDDPTAVLRAPMRLLDSRDQRLARLRASVAEGLAAIERGEGIEWTPELMDELEREADERIRLGLQPKPDVCP